MTLHDRARAEYDRWLDAIRDEGVNLSKWEKDFIESLREQRERGRSLSDKQAEILERIYSEKTP